MVLLFGVKHMHHTLIQFLNYRKKQSELSHFSLACHPLFQFLKILNFSNILKSLNSDFLIFVFESVNKTSRSCFHNFFLFSSSVHQYYTRQASHGDSYISRINSLQYGLKSIRYLGAKLWNSLPVELRNAPSKISFKKQLKIFLLNKVNH